MRDSEVSNWPKEKDADIGLPELEHARKRMALRNSHAPSRQTYIPSSSSPQNFPISEMMPGAFRKEGQLQMVDDAVQHD